MLTRVQFLREHRCFNRGRKIDFRAGVNLLVGDQGTGKSSLLNVLKAYTDQRAGGNTHDTIRVSVAQEGSVLSYDFERDNMRTLGHLLSGPAMRSQVSAMFSSHGETVNAILRSFDSARLEHPTLLLLDEPDMALSPRSARHLARTLQKLADGGHQIIAAVHNPIVIASQEYVLSLEHKRWMASRKFLSTHENS
jgi:predicted ATPase